MPDSDLQDLKNSCATGNLKSELQQLQEGETAWLVGRPVPSAEGIIGLAVSKTVTLVLQQKDVLDAVKQGEVYLVKTRIDANVLFRQEILIKADPARGPSCGCGTGGADADDGSAARRPLPPDVLRVPEIPDFFFDWDHPGQCFSDCRLELRCLPTLAPDGTVYKVCFPAWSCVTRCSPGQGGGSTSGA